MFKIKLHHKGQSLIEVLIVIGITAVILPALLTGLFAARGGKAQQDSRVEAVALLKETEEVVRSVREKGWSNVSQAGTYHPTVTGNAWSFSPGPDIIRGFTRSIEISDVLRDQNGVIVTSGGTLDTSTKKVQITINWGLPYLSTIDSTLYVTRYLDNSANLKTTQSEFDLGVKQNVATLNASGGEIALALNKAKWCSPEFSSTTIDLPDGPPVAVAATASASVTSPNNVFVATAPTATSSIKLAFVDVTANTDPPLSTLRGKFTLDSTQYSNPSYTPTGLGIDNDFSTNDVKYYKSSTNKTYALLATNLPNKEVIAILVDDNNSANDETTTGEYSDPVNNIFKYKTFFNTKINSSASSNDQAPYGYGASSIAVYGNRGYLASGGYLYVYNLANIDTATTGTSLPMLGCRIQLSGYDCNTSTSKIKKYGAGDTGTTYDTEQNWLAACSDGGNVERYATNDIYPIQVGNNTYVYVAIGGGTIPEFEIINVTTAPTSGSSLTGNSCGRFSGSASTNTAWRRTSTNDELLDFNRASNTQEAANSVFARADGNRAYVSSNGGIDADGNGQPDSRQFYVINTTNKSSPSFLSTGSSPQYQAASGYYYGGTVDVLGQPYHNDELFPRRSLTVLNGQRAILVGRDGIANGHNPLDYQVLNIENESAPTYCGGLNYNEGFNDLTSVTEADFDNFVYMVANTQEKQLKIIQGGPDAIYVEAGVYTSEVYDFGSSVVLNRFTSSVATPSGTAISYQVAVADPVGGSCTNASYTYVGPDKTGSSYFDSTGGPIPLDNDNIGFENPARCMRYKAYLSTTNYNVTPEIHDVVVNYTN